jgi:hypothetical protein
LFIVGRGLSRAERAALLLALAPIVVPAIALVIDTG